MTNDTIAYSAAHHPAKHRHRIGLGRLLFGLFAGPVVWAGNLMITYALGVHACFPGDTPAVQPSHGPALVWPLALGLHIVAMLICAAAFFVALRSWQISGAESEGHLHDLVDAGEGRTRFLGIIGMGFSLLFFCAVLFSVISLAIEPLCE